MTLYLISVSIKVGQFQVSLFGKGQNPRNFVAADDVAQFAVMALENGELNDRVIDIGGPEELTNMEVVRVYERLTDRSVKVSHVPLGALKVMYQLLRSFHPGLSQIMQSSICADTTDCTFDPAPMLDAYPVKLTNLEDWAAGRVGQSEIAATLAQA